VPDDPAPPYNPSDLTTEAFKYHTCCSDEDDVYGPESVCDEVDDDLLEALPGYDNTNDDHCCSSCVTLSSSTNEYKAQCTMTYVQGPSVCGTDSNDEPVLESDIYYRGSCSTYPNHTIDNEDGEVTVAEWNELVNEVQTNGYPTTQTGINTLYDDHEDAFDAPKDYFRAYLLGGDGVVNEATLTINAPNYYTMLSESYCDAKLIFQGGSCGVYRPKALALCDIEISGTSSVTVIDGTNAGTISSSSTGTIRIAGTINQGQLDVQNGVDVFITGVVNKAGGDLMVTNTDATIYDTSNAANIVFDGGNVFLRKVSNSGTVRVKAGTVDAEVCLLTGTVVIESGVTGSIRVPTGTSSQVTNNGGVTVTEYDATSQGCQSGKVSWEPKASSSSGGNGAYAVTSSFFALATSFIFALALI